MAIEAIKLEQQRRATTVKDPSQQKHGQDRDEKKRKKKIHRVTMIGEYQMNDYGNAKRFLDKHEQDLRYCPKIGWFVWSGIHWAFDETGQAESLLLDTMLEIEQDEEVAENHLACHPTFNFDDQNEAEDYIEAVKRFAHSSRYAHSLEGAMRIATRARQDLIVTPQDSRFAQIWR